MPPVGPTGTTKRMACGASSIQGVTVKGLTWLSASFGSGLVSLKDGLKVRHVHFGGGIAASAARRVLKQSHGNQSNLHCLYTAIDLVLSRYHGVMTQSSDGAPPPIWSDR